MVQRAQLFFNGSTLAPFSRVRRAGATRGYALRVRKMRPSSFALRVRKDMSRGHALREED